MSVTISKIVHFSISMKIVVDTGSLSVVLSVYSIWIWEIFGYSALCAGCLCYQANTCLFIYFELVNSAHSFTELILYHNGGYVVCSENHFISSLLQPEFVLVHI